MMISYAVETSRNGVVWTPETIFHGKLPLTRAEQWIDDTDNVAPELYARVVRVETGEVKLTAYPASFDASDIIRDITTQGE